MQKVDTVSFISTLNCADAARRSRWAEEVRRAERGVVCVSQIVLSVLLSAHISNPIIKSHWDRASVAHYGLSLASTNKPGHVCPLVD